MCRSITTQSIAAYSAEVIQLILVELSSLSLQQICLKLLNYFFNSAKIWQELLNQLNRHQKDSSCFKKAGRSYMRENNSNQKLCYAT